MIVYLCGKMTGMPDYNYPAFHAWAKRLRDAGHTVRNPAEEFDGDQSRTRSEYMDRAYTRILYNGPADESREGTWLKPCDAIAVLPMAHGDYQTSDGCFFELHLALIHKIPVYWADDVIDLDNICNPWPEEVLRSFINPPSARTQTPQVAPHVTPEVVAAGRATGESLGVQLANPHEVRVIDPKTGGEKGRKPQRYALVPMRAWQMILNATSPDEYGEDAALQSRQALQGLRDFIQRAEDDDNVLRLIGDRIVNALGGPMAALEAVSEVYHYGSAKYKDRNWERGYDWSLSIDSCYRHLVAVTRGQMRDPESGLPELAHALFHVLALLTFIEFGLGADDRSELYKGGK